MSDQFRIRESTRDDLPIILGHRRAMFHEMGLDDPEGLAAMEKASELFFSNGLADGSYRAWFVEDTSGRVIAGGGVGIIRFPPHPGNPSCERPTIFNVYTEQEFRGCGLGRKLMNLMIDWCRRQGYNWVMLHASDAGRPLYESMGFKPTSEMRLTLVQNNQA